MAGCSLSVTWLDEELESYWLAPADTPAFRRGAAVPSPTFTKRRAVTEDVATAVTAEASEESIAAAAIARQAVAAISATIEESKEELGRIDAVAGDGDHGIGMSRGAKAATEAADAAAGGVASVLAAAGAAFGDKAGGTSGILWGLLLDRVGRGLGNTDRVTADRVSSAVRQAADELKAFSKAELGDKTMLDALFPFVEALERGVAAGEPLSASWAAAAEAAVAAARNTSMLVPKIGRARPLAERSVGTPDPGAVSLGMIVTAIGRVLQDPHLTQPSSTGR
jgi:dihydroxyacetone kinase